MAARSVPPPARALDLQPPTERGHAVAPSRPARAHRDRRLRCRRREPRRGAVPSSHGCRDLGALRVRVLDDVGQRLGHDEVRARLDLRRNRSAGTSTSTGRSSRATNASTPARRPPRVEHGGQDPVRQLAQLRVALLGLLERLADERLAPCRRSSRKRSLSELERHDRVHQPLLRAVVQVAHHAAAGLVAGGEQARPRARRAGRGCRRSRSRCRAVRRTEPSAPRCRPAATSSPTQLAIDHAPEPTVDDDRRSDDRADARLRCADAQRSGRARPSK